MNEPIIRLFTDDITRIAGGRQWTFCPKRLAPKPGERVRLIDVMTRHPPLTRTVGNVIADQPGIAQDWCFVEFTS